MLLQTNSYVVPKEKRTEHARLLARFRQSLGQLGCDHFEVYEQTGANWSSAEGSGRFVQIMRFRDRNHQRAVQAAERDDLQAQALIREFCELIDFPSQQQAGKFVVGYYTSSLPVSPLRSGAAPAIAQVPVAPQAPAEHSQDLPPELPAEPTPTGGDEGLSGAMISDILDEKVDALPGNGNGESLDSLSIPGELTSDESQSRAADNGLADSGLEFLEDSEPQASEPASDVDSEQHRREHSL